MNNVQYCGSYPSWSCNRCGTRVTTASVCMLPVVFLQQIKQPHIVVLAHVRARILGRVTAPSKFHSQLSCWNSLLSLDTIANNYFAIAVVQMIFTPTFSNCTLRESLSPIRKAVHPNFRERFFLLITLSKGMLACESPPSPLPPNDLKFLADIALAS
jgi:hypothetical protein